MVLVQILIVPVSGHMTSQSIPTSSLWWQLWDLVYVQSINLLSFPEHVTSSSHIVSFPLVTNSDLNNMPELHKKNKKEVSSSDSNLCHWDIVASIELHYVRRARFDHYWSLCGRVVKRVLYSARWFLYLIYLPLCKVLDYIYVSSK